MARARNIKPGFFKNEDLIELAFEHRLLFIGLWTLADRDGKLEDRPKRIKMELFPADSVDVEQGLSELERYGFVERYEVGGVRIVLILAFTQHQSPHHTERKSDLPNKDGSLPVEQPKQKREPSAPSPEVNGEITVNPPKQDGGNPPDSLIHRFTDSPNPECGNQREEKPSPPAAQSSPAPKSPKATRLPADWQLPDDWLAWALTEQPSWTPEGARRVADSFRDYWVAKGGADARKVDWEATWRNWVRREKTPGLRSVSALPNRQEALEAKNRQVGEAWAARMQGGAL